MPPIRNKRKYNKKKSPQKRTYSTTKSSLVSLIKNVTLKQCETKMKDYNAGLTQLYHNTYHNLGNPFALSYPVQGDGDDQRVGDSIMQRGLKVRLLLTQKQDRMNVTFKLWLLKVPRGQSFTTSNIFDLTTNNTMLDSINPDLTSIVYSKTMKRNISPQLGGAGNEREFTFPLSFYIKRPKKITFITDASTTIGFSDAEYMLIIAPFDAHGTLITDNIASVQTFYRYYYKDP